MISVVDDQIGGPTNAHSIADLNELLPSYLDGSDELIFSIGKNLKIEKMTYIKIFIKTIFKELFFFFDVH